MSVADQIVALCHEYMKRQPDMPSLVVGYMQGTTPTTLLLGTTEQNGQGGAPTATSIYQIGSVTKTFTGTALAWMVANGSIALSDPAQNYVPTYANGGVTLPVYGPLPNALQITMLELADFTPGFPPDGPGGLASKSSWTDLAAYISNDATLVSAPGSQFAYVDDAFELLGSIVTWVWSGQTSWSYANLLTSLLSPGKDCFDMPDTVIVLSAEQGSRVVQGYNAGGAVNQPGGDWRIKSTLADMMVWLNYNMNLLDGCPLNNLLPSIQKPYFRLPNSTVSTGLGWFMQPVSSTITRYYKNGVSNGYSSYMALEMTNPNVAASNNGVVILNNLRDSKPGWLANHILDTLAGRTCAPANDALSLAEAGG